MPAPSSAHVLLHLSQSGLHLDDPDQDIRGARVLDATGETVGTVADLIIDEADRRVRFLDVSSNGFLGFARDHVLVPVEAVTEVLAGVVRIDRVKSTVADAPGFDARLAAPSIWEQVYGYYGYSPYWHAGAPTTPTFPSI
jgi:sporulation protein YlmC with PRC-barrel domain